MFPKVRGTAYIERDGMTAKQGVNAEYRKNWVVLTDCATDMAVIVAAAGYEVTTSEISMFEGVVVYAEWLEALLSATVGQSTYFSNGIQAVPKPNLDGLRRVFDRHTAEQLEAAWRLGGGLALLDFLRAA